MSDEVKVKCKSNSCGLFAGPFWAIGWLFTIGFLHLTFWKGVLAIIIWPYYLGAFFGK
jgi:hypothetical protein